MSEKIILLDPGHGGLINGKYVTAPRKMYKHENGLIIYEGVWNRSIVAKLCYLLKSAGVPVVNVANTEEDKPLSDRVEEANKWAKQYGAKNALYISIHANAGKGKGFEVYTSKGETMSDPVANKYMEAMAEQFPDRVARMDTTDGDKDKEANFYVLKKTACPAILTESFFMDNLEDAREMVTYAGMEKVVQAHLKTIYAFLNDELKPVKTRKTTPKNAAKKTRNTNNTTKKPGAKK